MPKNNEFFKAKLATLGKGTGDTLANHEPTSAAPHCQSADVLENIIAVLLQLTSSG